LTASRSGRRSCRLTPQVQLQQLAEGLHLHPEGLGDRGQVQGRRGHAAQGQLRQGLDVQAKGGRLLGEVLAVLAAQGGQVVAEEGGM
jgi:hypothetical protein